MFSCTGLRVAVFISALGFSTVQVQAAKYYVAPTPTGNDNAAGTLGAPFATMNRGQTAAVAGDTVYFRNGTYAYNSTTAQIGVTLAKSGAAGNLIKYWAYPGELPVFDFIGMTAVQRIKGVVVTGSYLHLRGFEMKNVPQNAALRAHEDWCIYVDGGGNNIFEQLDLHHNMGPGFFINAGGNNLILNSDSHDNYDAFSYTNGVLDAGQNADGFGFHSRNIANTGTVFRGCRAWWNADDGWDFIGAATSVTVENCWAWNNGYRAGTTAAAGNGNGFKVGGYGMPPSNYPAVLPQHIVRFCLGFDNRAAGFYQNHHPISNFYYNNTSFNNRSANFNLLGVTLSSGADASMGILRNNIAFTGTALSNAATGTGVDAAYNTWNLTAAVTNDFINTDTTGVSGPRQADGSLPNLGFMKLRTGSAMIDRGINVNLPYNGAAPDLGAFEYSGALGIRRVIKTIGSGMQVLRVMDLLGRRIFHPL